MTRVGRVLQLNFQPLTSYPGQVRIPGEEALPKKSKIDKVVSRHGVQIDWSFASERNLFGDRCSKWTDFEIRDLEKLRRFSPQPPGFTHTLVGIACSGARPMVSLNSVYNQAKALMGRVFLGKKPQPWGTGPCPGVWEWARKFVDELLPEFSAKPLSQDEWLESMPSVRRKILKVAAERYNLHGYSTGITKFKAFVKKELLPAFGKGPDDLTLAYEMIDRLIQAPMDEAHVVVGPYLKPLVYRLKELWTNDGYIHYGSNSPESNHEFLQRLCEREMLYFWSDYTGFDTTHSNDSWDFMEFLYRRAGIGDFAFWQVMRHWRRPRGKIGPFRYEGPVMNCSGRDDTALANGVLNGVCLFLSITAAYLNKPLRLLTVEDVRSMKGLLVLSVCGDDSVGGIPLVSVDREKQITADVISNIEKFGFDAKFFMSRNLLDCVYLGQRPYPVGGRWYWGKTIGRATYKMGWVLDKGQDLRAHMKGLAEMHSLCGSHVPILADLAKRVLELTGGAKRTPVKLDPDRPWEWPFKSGVPYDDSTLAAVAQVYDCTVADIRSLIALIQQIDRLPCVVDHWLWRKMILIDDL